MSPIIVHVTDDSSWIVTTLIPVLAALAGAFLGGLLTRWNDSRKDNRAKKAEELAQEREAAATFLGHVEHEVTSAVRDPKSVDVIPANDIFVAADRVFLVSSPEVAKLVRPLVYELGGILEACHTLSAGATSDELPDNAADDLKQARIRFIQALRKSQGHEALPASLWDDLTPPRPQAPTEHS